MHFDLKVSVSRTKKTVFKVQLSDDLAQQLRDMYGCHDKPIEVLDVQLIQGGNKWYTLETEVEDEDMRIELCNACSKFLIKMFQPDFRIDLPNSAKAVQEHAEFSADVRAYTAVDQERDLNGHASADLMLQEQAARRRPSQMRGKPPQQRDDSNRERQARDLAFREPFRPISDKRNDKPMPHQQAASEAILKAQQGKFPSTSALKVLGKSVGGSYQGRTDGHAFSKQPNMQQVAKGGSTERVFQAEGKAAAKTKPLTPASQDMLAKLGTRFKVRT